MKKLIAIFMLTISAAQAIPRKIVVQPQTKTKTIDKTYRVDLNTLGSVLITIHQEGCTKGLCVFSHTITDTSGTYYSMDDGFGYRIGSKVFFTEHVFDSYGIIGHVVYGGNLKKKTIGAVLYDATGSWFVSIPDTGAIRRVR